MDFQQRSKAADTGTARKVNSSPTKRTYKYLPILHYLLFHPTTKEKKKKKNKGKVKFSFSSVNRFILGLVHRDAEQ